MDIMATLKQRLHRKNASGTYDTVQLETDSSIVMRPSGRSVEQDLTDFLPKSQASDTVPNSLKKGQLVAGDSKVWVGTDGLSEVSLSGHKHASTDITVSDFFQTLLETTDIDTSLIKLSDKIDVIDDQLNS